jgi:phosphoribosylformylglycinamidine synthase subunit PurS
VIARVVVVPKPVVNDPQGVTVRQGLRTLGFAEVADVRVGKYIEVTLDSAPTDQARSRVEQMCRQLLANQVIEDFRFDILPSSGEPGSPHPALPQEGGGKQAPP